MRLLSWNVNGRVELACRRQIDAVTRLDPDVIALQEVTLRSYGWWTEELNAAGYSIASTIDLLGAPYPEPPYAFSDYSGQIKRKNFNLITSRIPFATLPGLSFDDPEELRFAVPEKHLAVQAQVDGAAIEIHNTHLPPGSSRGEIKVHHFEAIARRMGGARRQPRVLCGDFNAPWSENQDGPEIQGDPGSRWGKAELSVIANRHLRDAYRDVHKADTDLPVSHRTGRGKARIPHRYDYVFVSKQLGVAACRYEDPVRDDGKSLSDHALVLADLVLD